MRNLILLLACAAGLLWSSAICQAADMITTNVVGGNTGWNTSGIWKTNGTGTAVTGVVPGNSYQCVFNGTAWGNSRNNTRMRNLYASTSPSPQPFPGDSLTLNADTEFRFKRIAAGNVPVVVFPGVGTNPGLILNGGILNGGDDDTFTIGGTMRIDSLSYISQGNNGGGGPTAAGRAFNITANISGNGNLAFLQCSNYVAQTVAGNNESYAGTWIIKSALVRATGLNSLGTNSHIIIDPGYFFTLDSSVVDYQGPAILEPMYDVNSAGTLTIGNGGQVRLHQNCSFTAVTIDGAALSPGTHYFAELTANYPANFPAGGSGAITVKPYGLPPLIFTMQPQTQMSLYAGRTARLSALAAGPGTISYQWRKNGQNLSDGPGVSGATSSTLVLSSVSGAEQASYDVVAANGTDTTTSSACALTVVATPGPSYAAAVLSLNPAAYYSLNETTDPASGARAFDFAGGGLGTYGAGVQNGSAAYNIAGPTPAQGFAGFASDNKAAQFANMTANSRISIPALNLNTNSVTITAWINPSGPQTAYSAIFFCRGSGTVAGLNYTPAQDANGNLTLGYHWNGEGETYRWDSGIAPTPGQWSFVALVITPTNATLHVLNPSGAYESVNPYSHVPQSFAGTTLIGGDSNDGGNGARSFSGIIDEVAIYADALTKAQLMGLYAAPSTSVTFAPKIALGPASLGLYRGQTASFRVVAGGSDPLTYQWKAGPMGSATYTNVVDSSRISGATTSILTLNNISDWDGGDYVVTVQNLQGSVTTIPASLSIFANGTPEVITMSVQQPAGDNWDGSQWSDGMAASLSAAFKPGSTYELLGGARLRTPETNRTSIFPGSVLTLRGSSIWVNNPGATDTSISEIRFKQPNPGRVNFPRLVINGGQIDAGNDGIVEIGGRMDILTNAPFYNDSGNDRGYYVDAWLTGTGTIEYRGYNQTRFMPNYANNLNIAGSSNTFSGKWNVVLGTLLATSPNALGTNDIIIGTNGAFEATYDLNNTSGNLFLGGRMYLHQNHTFRSVFVAGTPLNVGTYTFAQLNAAYPTNFPATWTPQNGATNFSAGSGSITVLVQPAPVITQQPVSVSVYPTENVQFTVAAQGTPPLGYRWRKGGSFITDGGNVFGSLTTTLVLSNVTAGNAGSYDVVVTNVVGSVTSQPATLTLLPTGPALNVALDYGGAPIVQAQGNDWNTLNQWTDGRAASAIALANPGSTFTVAAGARLRSPTTGTDNNFPGEVITVEGDGVFLEGSTTAGEIRFKHTNPGSVYFKRLVMNGGMLDSGDNGVMSIRGRMDILANTPIYADSGAGQDRPWQIDAWLTGTGTVEYHAFNNSFAGNLNITGISNTFSGKWNIVQGVLLGSGASSLGTNEINIGLNGALEALYDIRNYTGSLILDGQLFLHNSHSFKEVTVAGTPLAPGTYTFAQLNGTYPANFPASWPQQIGSAVSTGSGTLTILGDTPPPVIVQHQYDGTNLVLSWTIGTLLEAENITGPWSTNNSPSPFTVRPNPATPSKFYKVQVR